MCVLRKVHNVSRKALESQERCAEGGEGIRKSLAHFFTVLTSPSPLSFLPERQQRLNSGQKSKDRFEHTLFTVTILTEWWSNTDAIICGLLLQEWDCLVLMKSNLDRNFQCKIVSIKQEISSNVDDYCRWWQNLKYRSLRNHKQTCTYNPNSRKVGQKY